MQMLYFHQLIIIMFEWAAKLEIFLSSIAMQVSDLTRLNLDFCFQDEERNQIHLVDGFDKVVFLTIC